MSADEQSSATSGDPANEPVLRVVRGAPSADELAALAAVVSATASAPDRGADVHAPHGRWSDPAQRVRRTWAHGPGGWRAAVR